MITPRMPIAAFRRSRAGKAAAVAMLALIATALWSPSAVAVSANETLPMVHEDQGWFWSSNREVRQCVGTGSDALCQVSDLSGASPVEPGHLAVALQNGNSDMRTYLRFNLPEATAVSSMTLTLPISRADPADTEHTTHHTGPGAKAPSTTNEARAAITACAVTLNWGNVEGSSPYTMDPRDPTKTEAVEPFVKDEIDCNAWSVKGKPGPKAWTFDLTGAARKWVDGSLDTFQGIILLPDLTAATDSWRVEFHGAAVSVQNNDVRQVYVSPKEAGAVRIAFTAPDPEPQPTFEPTPGPIGGGGTIVPPPPATFEPIPTVAPSVEPEPSGEPTEPVGGTATSAAWYAWLVLPVGAAAYAGLARAVGREAADAGANRVAAVLRRRRLERPGD